jgi:hypothetical protein
MSYDRDFLLYGEKRNAVLELREIQRYGTDSYGDPDYVSVYGMRPTQWHAKGIRLMGRTAVECTRDDLGSAIGRDVATIAGDTVNTLVVDPFAGSGNTLYWLLHNLPGARGLGFEVDAGVFELTRNNFAALDLPIEILNTDYLSGLTRVPATPGGLLVVFIAPPWGDALDPISGLDLRMTQPPIPEIVDHLLRHFDQCKLLCAIQIYETIKPESLAELESGFEWRALRMYGLNAPGRNHGVLLGTAGWRPSG